MSESKHPSTSIAKIIALGTSLPPYSILQSDAAQLACDLGITKRWLKALPTLYRASGVETRHSVLLEQELLESMLPEGDLAGDESLVPVTSRQSFYPLASENPQGPTTRTRMEAYEQYSTDLAFRSSKTALDIASAKAGIEICDITHLVTVSCSGFSAPGVDIHLIKSLGLNSEIQRTHVGFMGCHGALNGIRVAKAIAESSPEAVVLLCAVELCSLHQQYTDDAQQLVANSLFADGSAALIISAKSFAENKQAATETPVIAAETSWSIIDTGSALLPDTTDMMSWRIADHGFEMSLSPKVPSVVEEMLRPWLERFLARNGTSIDQIDGWVIHPGGPRILVACRNAIPLNDAQMEWSEKVLLRHGNMSSPTVLFILNDIAKQTSYSRCMMLAFGPGLCIEGCLLERSN